MNIFNLKITRVLSLALALLMMFVFCSCKKSGDSDATSSDATYTVNSTNEEDNSSETVSDVSSESSEEAVSSEDAPSGADTPSSSSGAVSSAVQLPTTTNPQGVEILGAGTKDNPYLELPNVSDNFMSVTTVSIPAGKTVFYGIQRVVGTILTIENANAYVIYNTTRYDAKNGKVSFEVVDAKALASDNIMFEIGNKGASAASFKLIFTNKTGSRENPTSFKTLGTNVTVNLEADNGTGYYYKYIAEKAGKLRFYMSSTVDGVISITNNATSKNLIGNYTKSTAKLTDPDNGDAVVEYIELDVAKGDEIVINVGAVPNKRGKYPAATITWSAKFA